MTVHLFGAKSSPSCATFCLRETAREFGKHFDPIVVETVLNAFYVDDCLTGAETEEAAAKLIQDLRSLLAMGGFKLTKWLSSNTHMETVPDEEKSKSINKSMPSSSTQQRVLGISWDVAEDEFFFKISVPDSPPTKRGTLAVTNSLYDPLGLVMPVVLLARILYSELCRKNLDWDEPITGSFIKRWLCWLRGLEDLQNVRIPRCYQLKFSSEGQIQFHFFSDASNIARGTVCYARMTSANSIQCSLVISKAHLCGTGRNTIPRLELEAALDSIKLSREVKQELGSQGCPCYFWTDSTIVLRSLHANSKKFCLFPRNRLQQILDHSKVYDWGFLGSKNNPADRLTRSTSAKFFAKDSSWFSGPPFLYLTPDKWPLGFRPNQTPDTIYDSFNLERMTANKDASNEDANCSVDVNICHVNASRTAQNLQPLTAFIWNFSSLFRLKLACSWLIRFKSLLKARKRNPQPEMSPIRTIDIEDLRDAEVSLIRYVQLQNFSIELTLLRKNKTLPKISSLYKLDPIIVDNVLRVGGRLHEADLDYDLKHPIILPEDSHLTTLIIRDAHANFVGHGGVNSTLNFLCQRYWIVNPRIAVKRVLNQCIVCRRTNSRLATQVIADLPKARLKVHKPPFSYVGVDYFGPLYVKLKRSEVKRYGCLFTCLTCRAIHLEVAQDLSTSAFINALRRFVSRRGPVLHIYSDNGTNFVGSARLLQDSIDSWNQS